MNGRRMGKLFGRDEKGLHYGSLYDGCPCPFGSRNKILEELSEIRIFSCASVSSH